MKKFFLMLIFAVMILPINCQAKDVYMGETLEGSYWAISETLEIIVGDHGDAESDYCDIDFKIVENGKYKIYHCTMWSSDQYIINNGIMEEPKNYPHPMYNLYRYTIDRINRGDYKGV